MYQNQDELSHKIIKDLRKCGHFLHYKMCENPSRKRILFALLQEGKLLQRELQCGLGVKSGSLSEIVGKMEADGLIYKDKSAFDGRNFVIKLTDKGMEQARTNHEEYDERVETLTSCLSEEEKNTLIDLLDRLLESWDDEREKDKP